VANSQPNQRRIVTVYQHAHELRRQLLHDLEAGSFASNDYRMDEWNQLRAQAIVVLPGDQVLPGLPEMPDDVMVRGWGASAPPEAATTRTESVVTRLIRYLEFIFPELRGLLDVPVSVAGKPYSDFVGPESRYYESVSALSETVAAPIAERREFSWISDSKLRAILMADFIEAQQSLAVGAHKGAALLASAVIEGMILDVLSRQSTMEMAEFATATAQFRKDAKGLPNWDSANLVPMMNALVNLQLVSPTALKWIEGTTDMRDTIHARAEWRSGNRARKEEATLLVALVGLLDRDLSKATVT
jgi:hypothetical protein